MPFLGVFYGCNQENITSTFSRCLLSLFGLCSIGYHFVSTRIGASSLTQHRDLVRLVPNESDRPVVLMLVTDGATPGQLFWIAGRLVFPSGTIISRVLPSEIHRKGDLPENRPRFQSTFNLFFFRHSPGLEASSCSGRCDSICIVRLSALRRLLRVLTRDHRVCSPACPLWGVAPQTHSGGWALDVGLTGSGGSDGREALDAAGRGGRYSRRFKVVLRAPARL